MAAPAVAQDEMAGPEPFADDAKPYVPIVSKGFQHQFWQAVKGGAEAKGAELNMDVNFIGPETESQIAKQIEMLQAEYDKGPDAVCFAALDSQAALPLLETMQADGIPVIAFDSGVEGDIPITTAATDNIAAAGLAADKMAELIGGSGKVGAIVHDQVSRTGIDRGTGFVEGIAKYPDIELVGPVYPQKSGDELQTIEDVKTMIQANPDIKGIFAANEGTAQGLITAVTELDMVGDFVLIGYDSGLKQINAIKDGTMAGAVQQNPVGIGAKCVEAAAMAIQGMEVDPMIDTGFIWADASNIDSDAVKAVLYE
jgi:ribose transport system substrate-binding protein